MFFGFALIHGGLAFAQGGGPPVGGPGAGSTTVITKAEPNFTNPAAPVISIHGDNFGTSPLVTLGDDFGMFTTLTVTLATDMLIDAELPPAIVPGSYMLIVQAGAAATNTGILDVTIGTVGPQGPIGPEGPEGLEGRIGPEGPQGPQGPIGFPGTSSWSDGSGKVTTGVDVGIGTTTPAGTSTCPGCGGNLLDVFGTLRTTGQTVPTSGLGIEIGYSIPTNRGGMISFDRTNGVFSMLKLSGAPTVINADPGAGFVGIGLVNPTERLHVVGNILATGSITPGSSRAFKDNIAPLTAREALDAFAALEPIKFTYKADESEDLQLGFIAEDVPELVSIPSRNGVAPMDLIAVLTKVVQTQQERIADLEERFRELEESSRHR